ncbi:MAG: diguanylate cyclase [Candidatus Acidiferrales bacterium]
MKILIAEDDPVSRRVLEEFLKKWGYEVVAVANGADAWARLAAEGAPRMAILDWMMPELEGIEICRLVRARSGRAYTFLILVTAHGQRYSLLAGLKAGADDYLSKPFDAEELRARLQVGERILRMQDELIAAHDALHFQATHDLLTGVSSRGAAMDFLTRELARGFRENRTMGIVLADLDYFKHINDQYGHLVGDAVLQELARRMLKCVRAYDCVGRYGGEEFLIIFPSSNEEGTMRQTERIRKLVEYAPIQVLEAQIPVTASFGIVTTDPSRLQGAMELLCNADAALYRAKELGRNRVERAVPAELLAVPSPEKS